MGSKLTTSCGAATTGEPAPLFAGLGPQPRVLLQGQSPELALELAVASPSERLAVPPLAALLLGVFGAVSTNAAVWIAFGFGLVVLAAQGIVFARVKRLRWPATLLVVAANVGLGLALVGLKVFLTH
jgi:hypothetical protein